MLIAFEDMHPSIKLQFMINTNMLIHRQMYYIAIHAHFVFQTHVFHYHQHTISISSSVSLQQGQDISDADSIYSSLYDDGDDDDDEDCSLFERQRP